MTHKNKYVLMVIASCSFFCYLFFVSDIIIPDVSMKPYVIPDNCDFNAVIEGGFGRNGGGIRDSNECSPKIINSDYAGIVINAPKEVFFTTNNTNNNENAIPICGTYADALGVFSISTRSLVHSIVFVVVDAKTNQAWSGKIPEIQNKMPRPKGKHERQIPLAIEDLKGRTITGYFNPNVFNIISIPLYETEYIIYATIGPYKSNVVTIKLTKK